MARSVDWAGFETEYIKVISVLKERSSSNKKVGECLCKFCGNIFNAIINNVVTLTTKNCGCVRKEKLSTHNMSESRIYQCWASMKYRCEHSLINYENVGYCERWRNFENFYEDMREGYEDELTIDRIDFTLGYSKDNCRWVDKTTQVINRRKPEVNRSSEYRNVSRSSKNTYSARVTYNYVTHTVGYYESEVEAAKAVDEYIILNNLPHKLNFNHGD